MKTVISRPELPNKRSGIEVKWTNLKKKKIDAILLGFEMLWSIVKWKIYFALPRHLQSSCKLKKNVTHLD